MDPFKIIGGILIVLGVVFRAVSIAYFKMREQIHCGDPKALQRYAAKKKRALLIDYGFIVFGIYTLLIH